MKPLRGAGLEPARVNPPDPKSGASASSATLAGIERKGMEPVGLEPTTYRLPACRSPN